MSLYGFGSVSLSALHHCQKHMAGWREGAYPSAGEQSHGESTDMCMTEITLLWKSLWPFLIWIVVLHSACVIWMLKLPKFSPASGINPLFHSEWDLLWQATSTVKLKKKMINSIFAAQDNLDRMFGRVRGPLYLLCTGVLVCHVAGNGGELNCFQTSTKSINSICLLCPTDSLSYVCCTDPLDLGI